MCISPFFPLQIEHSDAHLCYIGCSPKSFNLTNKDRSLDFIYMSAQIFFLFILRQISCSNFWLDRTFQACAQTLFFIRFRPNSVNFPTSFSLFYSNILTYIFLCSGTNIKKFRNWNSPDSENISGSIRQAACSSV
jgi:hypothetical protein